MATSSGGGLPGVGASGIMTFKAGLWRNNPIAIQILGICSALAVTTRAENALVMGLAVVFVLSMSNLVMSLLRRLTPRRIRMIVEVTVIATFVIVVDLCLKAYYPDMSERLGPYVGLIITNCIIMGRAEAFALHNKPGPSLIDALANGLGYTFILVAIGLVREIGGRGRLMFGDRVLFQIPAYEPNQILAMAPGAFIVLGFLVAILYVLGLRKDEEAKP